MKVEEDALIKKGAKIATMGSAPAEKLAAAFEKGLWDISKRKDPIAVGEFYDFAKKNGLTN